MGVSGKINSIKYGSGIIDGLEKAVVKKQEIHVEYFVTLHKYVHTSNSFRCLLYYRQLMGMGKMEK